MGVDWRRLCQCEQITRAHDVFAEMIDAGCNPNAVTFNSFILDDQVLILYLWKLLSIVVILIDDQVQFLYLWKLFSYLIFTNV